MGPEHEGYVFGIGNPLLDFLATVDEQLCQRYDLKLDDAILADERHMPLYDELVENFNVDYAAGGATLNTIRMIQWLVETPYTCSYVGCIGNDKAGEILQRECDNSKLCTKFQIAKTNSGTGKCAVLLQNHHRSMVTHLGACKELTLDYVERKDVWEYVERAHVYYVAGFAINACFDALLRIGAHSQANGKLFCFNLSAPFLQMFYTKEVDALLPYADILFANRAEFDAYVMAHNLPENEIENNLRYLANIPRISNVSRKRIVVITQASDPVLLAVEGNPIIREIPVPRLPTKDIVDTNGAGDAFASGFIAEYMHSASIDKAVKEALKSAVYIIKRSGFTLGSKNKY
ncbi:unnamed protein product [Calicophoron daubneyi]|uniref:Adenosine kinase n=1 Tax=Calicophoron daubneyi TaxID=300641 RepID=A0AAV2TVQ6_CALDB